jgi:hypothetical protein
MALQENQDSEIQPAPRRMPRRFAILFWIIIANMILTALVVWGMAFFIVERVKMGQWVQLRDFRTLMMGFHIILLIMSLMGWHMQTMWNRIGDMIMYPHAMVIGSVMLDVAAIKLAILTFSGYL